MYKLYKTLSLIILLMLALSSCHIGADTYKEPWEIDNSFRYRVIYNALGGKINSSPVRETYYVDGSLLKKPQGSAGLLTEPVFGNKIVFGWYTAYKNIGSEKEPVYEFDQADLWDFETDRISDENTDHNKTLTLYAHWIDPPSIMFVDADNTENILMRWEIVETEKRLSKPTTFERKIIEKSENLKKTTYSLLDYFRDPDCNNRVLWENGKTVREIIQDRKGDPNIYIYCKYIEGKYTRIKNKTDLKNITDMNGKYIIADHIDMKNEFLLPLGDFSGVIIGNGYTISNLSITATNRAGLLDISSPEKSFGLFSELCNASFIDINIDNITISVDKKSNADICVGVFGGRATNTVFENCTIQNSRVISDGKVEVNVSVGNPAFTDKTCTIKDCGFSDIDTEGLNIGADKLNRQ